MASEPEPVAPSAINIILEGIKQFGLAADGSDLRDLVAAAEQRGRDAERAQADFPEWATDAYIAEGILAEAETIVQLLVHDKTEEIAEHTGAIKSHASTLLSRRERIGKYLAATNGPSVAGIKPSPPA